MAPRLFLDLDGVLADFDRGYADLFGSPPDRTKPDTPDMWKRIADHGSFFRSLHPMPDARELWDFTAQLRPTILTGAPHSVPDVEAQKVDWVRVHLGETVPVIVCRSADKCLHAKPGDVLVDDWEKYQPKWLAAGGRWITHRSARQSIGALLEMGLGL